ncbi:Transferring glycosyl group transferase [Quillaja saponaria]|uniref:Transferring glycosyl group transferase n=1 Tax=Quillaja saponaria TaxID=32244 RepID=A0AAD7LMP1_QUISA|nr:Transferring glycosyl group transferase [Quillaja saponaria]
MSDISNEATNISHIVFGLGGSLNTWRDRSHYSKLWWDENTTRGFLWLDGKPDIDILRAEEASVPYRISEEWTRFKYLSSQPAVRIARIVHESFKLGLPNVRWFVMGDDDTMFFTENLVSVLAKYDHNEMYYIGANSESVEQNVAHGYEMAFGGGGFAVSYPLAEKLVQILDDCLYRYYYFYGSDQRIWACVSEFDIRGNSYGLLAAHPLAPLLSLHHLDYLDPMFPNQTQIDSLKSLMGAYRVDPSRILQQSFCYDRSRRWSISVSWGYTIQIYTTIQMPKDLQIPLQTFRTWGSWSDGPFTFNTRTITSDPCEEPIIYFLDQVEEVGKSGSLTSYKKFVAEDAKNCKPTVEIESIVVSAMKMDPENFSKAPRRQCCDIMDRGRLKNESLRIRIRKCRPKETITM